MKILYVYREWYHRFKIFGQIMQKLGHEVISKELSNEKVHRKDVDWCDIVWIHKPQLLKYVPDHNKPIITYNPAISTWKVDGEREYAPFHKVFIPSKYEVEALKDICEDNKFIYVPWGYDQRRYFHKSTPKKIDYSYAGAGQKEERKTEWLLKAKERLPITFFGRQICRAAKVKERTYSRHTEQRKIYWRTKCNIDCPLTNERRDFIPYQKMRFFEIPACGEILLTYYSDEFAELFDPDTEVFYYRTLDELVDKAQWIVKNYDKLDSVRADAIQRAQYDHTFEGRISVILNYMKGQI